MKKRYVKHEDTVVCSGTNINTCETHERNKFAQSELFLNFSCPLLRSV